ncbi:MAG: DUF1638 domain-containing protein [Gemmatimonadetes bacterium]|nr:DUF1638 domain-containing protein [Gemmatimonadota bacterium]
MKVLACEVFFREICHCAARSPNLFDFEYLSQGYHDNPLIGVQKIQESLDALEPGRFDAILVGYGLCNNMLNGLRAPADTKLIVPRAHDCITFFLGSRERYSSFFLDNPGTYYYTTGWLEHRERGGERPERKQGAGLGTQMEYDKLATQYGEENAKYLLEVMNGWTANYDRGVFIDFEFSRHLPCKETARQICVDRGWKYEEIEGDLSLFQQWLDGPWPEEDYLVVEGGQRIVPSYEDGVIQIDPVQEGLSTGAPVGGA